MSKFPAITEKKFRAAKILIQSGASNKEVADYLEIGLSTVGRIKAAEDYEDFCQARKAAAYKAKVEAQKQKQQPEEQEQPVKQIVEHQQSVTIIANQYMAEQLKKQTELLTMISNKLAFIVDELCGVPTQKEG